MRTPAAHHAALPPDEGPPPRRDRMRLDSALVQQGLAASRSRAQAAILAGEVFLNGQRAAKAGTPVSPGATLELRPRRPTFVSRGGYKLDWALAQFGLHLAGLTVADVGASTGGFTDCLLQHGVRRVVAIDVGTGQLDWTLRRDPRVTSVERRDVRSVAPEDLGEPVDAATVDVSFISVGNVLPAVGRLVRAGGVAVVLVKPQFEAGPKAAPHGVVSDPQVHRQVLARVLEQVRGMGWSVLDATPSPLAGPHGNLEFFLYLRKSPGASRPIDVDALVAVAHATIKRKSPSKPGDGAAAR